MTEPALFAGFFMGGFECSTHRLRSGQRLDMIAASGHDRFCDQDYARLREQNICVAREGIRWHLIERFPRQYDFASVHPMVAAARKHGIQLVWDVCHYGWPEDIDIFSPEFVHRFGCFAAQFAAWLRVQLPPPYYFCPINEISFFSWAGADNPHLDPYCTGRGFELKCQLVRAAIQAMDAIWAELPEARFVHADPLVHIVPKANRPKDQAAAEGYRLAQYQAFDMLSGRIWPQLGGHPKYLDIVGLNFYPTNEWVYQGPTLRLSDPRYRPLRDLLREVHYRYNRPMFISETGTEGRRRASWLRYVCHEVKAAMEDGIPIHGICLYPIVNHPGWVDERHCHNGLWDYPDARGQREIYRPLARELQAMQRMFEMARGRNRDVTPGDGVAAAASVEFASH